MEEIGEGGIAPVLDQVVEEFWRERQRGVYFPPQWFDRLSLEDGYRVQIGLVRRMMAAGRRQVGWKVGLTAEPIQRQFGVHEPVFGHILDDAPLQSPATLPFGQLIQPGVENEICIELGQGLAGPGVDEGQVRAAVAAVRPALEIIETRGPLSLQLALALAENAQQKAIVLGPATRPLPANLDLAQVQAEVFINGESVATGTGAAVLGNPLRSVAWLANKLAEFGLRLEVGQLIMSGSLTRQFPMRQGDHVRAVFAPLGVAEAQFA